MLKARLGMATSAALVALAGPAFADAITPSSFSATIGVGGTATVDKNVLVSMGTPTTAQADVYFLSDTTGSMGPTIAAVKTGFSQVVTGLAGFGNIAFGAGEFKDLGDGLPLNGGSYRIDQTINANAALTQTAINGWSAGGRGYAGTSAFFAENRVGRQHRLAGRVGEDHRADGRCAFP